MNINFPGMVSCPEFHSHRNNVVMAMARLWRRESPGICAEVYRCIKRQAAWLVLIPGFASVTAQDFTVTSPGSFYSINNQGPNPTLTLVRGRTYTFSVATSSSHPFQILSPGNAVGNNTSSGTITYTVATNAPATINPGYRCSIHNFSGIIQTVAPPLPPAPVINILNLSVGSNLVLRSTGTNGWNVLPEFKTNLSQGNWSALTVQTNTFANGTNETICGKPPGDTVIIRIRSQPN
jgi:hypothetical protein